MFDRERLRTYVKSLFLSTVLVALYKRITRNRGSCEALQLEAIRCRTVVVLRFKYETYNDHLLFARIFLSNFNTFFLRAKYTRSLDVQLQSR